MGYTCGKNYGIYSVKIMGHIMPYIGLKLLDIFVKLRDLFRETMG